MIREIKRKKWDKENLQSPEEKRRDLKINKHETKKYREIEYNLISLESYSGRKWIALESDFKFPKDILYDLRENFDFQGDFLWYDSLNWNQYPIEYQWNKMDKRAKTEIDRLYKLYEDRKKLLNNKIIHLKKIISNLENFINDIKGSE